MQISPGPRNCGEAWTSLRDVSSNPCRLHVARHWRALSGATQTRCTSDLVVNPTVPNANLGAVAARVTARHSDDDDDDDGDGDGDDEQ